MSNKDTDDWPCCRSEADDGGKERTRNRDKGNEGREVT